MPRRPTVQIPSLQHVARTWRDNPDAVARGLVATARRPPQFSCDPLNVATRDLMVLKVPYAQVEEYIRRAERRPNYQRVLLEVMPLLRRYLNGINPDFFQGVAKRYYPVAQDIMIPFQPPLIYGLGGQLTFPWFSWWRSNPLAGASLSLFVTLMDEMLLQDPDLETAIFQILDFSKPKGEEDRALIVTNAADIPRLSASARNEMLAIWAEGLRRARKVIADAPEEAQADQDNQDRPGRGQRDLFEDPPGN
jgi:hypothetical protein